MSFYPQKWHVVCRSVGVSNFGVHHLEALREAGRPLPAVNQIELHVWHRTEDLVAYCRQQGIVVMGFSPLVKALYMDDPAIVDMAKR